MIGRPFAYSHRTPLEKLGWDLATFGRCNTHCRDCQRENGVRLCTVSYEMLRGFRFNPRPPRQVVEPKPIPWRGAMRLCLLEHGRMADLEQVYGWFSRRYPWLPNKPSWKFRIRVTIQQVAVNVGKGKWSCPKLYRVSNQPLVVR